MQSSADSYPTRHAAEVAGRAEIEKLTGTRPLKATPDEKEPR